MAQALRTVVRHIAFRIGIAVSSAALTVALLLGIMLSNAFMNASAPLSFSESLAPSMMAAAFTVPTIFGVVIILPQNRTWVRWIGALIIFVITPSLLSAMLNAGYVETFSEEFYWILMWILAAIVYWVLLRPLHKMPQDTHADKKENKPLHPTAGNAPV